jgi:hypothetical protein
MTKAFMAILLVAALSIPAYAVQATITETDDEIIVEVVGKPDEKGGAAKTQQSQQTEESSPSSAAQTPPPPETAPDAEELARSDSRPARDSFREQKRQRRSRGSGE